MIRPQNILPNLSTDGQENATFGAKNTNPQTAISKPDTEWAYLDIDILIRNPWHERNDRVEPEGLFDNQA